MTITSNEYAIALFSLAKENGIEDEIFESLKIVKNVLDETDDLTVFLSSPAIPKSIRLETLNNAFEGKIHEYVLSALCILCENKNIDIFYEFYREFVSLYDSLCKVSIAYVSSPIELDEEEKQKLTEKLEKISGNKVMLKTKIDETLIGGLTVNMDGVSYDGSIKNRLKSIKEVMNG